MLQGRIHRRGNKVNLNYVEDVREGAYLKAPTITLAEEECRLLWQELDKMFRERGEGPMPVSHAEGVLEAQTQHLADMRDLVSKAILKDEGWTGEEQ